MLAFLKNHTLDNLKQKLLVLYMLNVTDILFTFVLVNSGYFRELNFFLVKAVDSPLASFILKIVLPSILLRGLFYRMQKANDQQLRIANILITSAAIFYSAVNVMHLIWFTFLLLI